MGTKAALTVADLAKLPPLRPEEGHHYELSDGELIIVGNASGLHELVKSNIARALVAYELQTRRGRTLTESQFNLSPECARVPDVAFVTGDLHPASSGFDTTPDLVVEVISPSETAEDAERKVQEYLRAGVAEVWQIYAIQQVIQVRRASQSKNLHSPDVLASVALPGFSVRVSEFFE